MKSFICAVLLLIGVSLAFAQTQNPPDTSNLATSGELTAVSNQVQALSAELTAVSNLLVAATNETRLLSDALTVTSNQLDDVEAALTVTSNQLVGATNELTAVSNQVQAVDAALTTTSNQLVTATNDIQGLADDIVALTNGNVIIGGTLSAGVAITYRQVGTNILITPDNVSGQVIMQDTNAAALFILPDPTEGDGVTVANTIFDNVLSIDVTNVLHSITLDGVQLPLGNKIDSPGDKNDRITIVRRNSTNWFVFSRSGTWIDGGP